MIVLDESPVAPDGDGIASATANFSDNFKTPTDLRHRRRRAAVSYGLILNGANVASGMFRARTQAAVRDKVIRFVLNMDGERYCRNRQIGTTEYIPDFNQFDSPALSPSSSSENVWHADTGYG